MHSERARVETQVSGVDFGVYWGVATGVNNRHRLRAAVARFFQANIFSTLISSESAEFAMRNLESQSVLQTDGTIDRKINPWEEPFWKPARGKSGILFYLVLIHILAAV